MLRNLKELVSSLFYIGFLPGAPGTYASVAAAAAFVIARRPLGVAGWIALAGIVAVGLAAASRAREIFGTDDPPQVVIDEAAGMWLALVVGGSATFAALVIAFVLFRAFDIAKPVGIDLLERVKGAAGIMADDLAAGLLAGLVTRLILYFAVN